MPNLLASIDHPSVLRKLPRHELPRLAAELRAFILQSVAQTGGHLASNLGTVELTIALHYVFDTPDDRIVWDVGHQAYAHKILTGRREAMATLRQWDGMAGFPRRDESVFDAFGTAHSSTSISAALGMALASKLKATGQRAIAVIGDGALSAGEAFEALNHAGVCEDVPLLVILNDNDMSISPSVGALRGYLARSRAHHCRADAHRSASVATMFEELGFHYTGPIDGHDLDALVAALAALKQSKGPPQGHHGGPQFLHVVTRKGRGYRLAEADPVLYHGPGKFNLDEGIKPAARPAPQTYTKVFGEWLCDAAERDARVVGITPAMREGSGLVEFEARFPQALFRCRHCRTARHDLCRRSRGRRHEAGTCDLLDVLAARLRSVDSRYCPAKSAGAAGDRSRRTGRCRWPHARGRIRPGIFTLHSQHDGDGAG